MPQRCTDRAESIISLQRQMIAQRVKQSKGQMLPASRATCPNPTCDRMKSLPPFNDLRNSSSQRAATVLRPRQPFQQVPCNPSYTSLSIDFDEHSVSTATMSIMTHEQAPPLHLFNFKPAVGCISASDFLIRVFVARLRSGVTVFKHNRSRFSKSPCLYILTLDADRASLLWKKHANTDSLLLEEPNRKTQDGNGKTSTSRQRLNLSECREVRMAWSADPQNPQFTGSAILREKCAAEDAHKSFSLIFENRTLDITAATADQCKMLTEGFSALCYRLHLKKSELNQGATTRDPCCIEEKESTSRRCLRVLP